MQKNVYYNFYFLVAFIDMNIFILTEGTNFKINLRESYSISLEGCYLFNNNIIEDGTKHDISSAYGVYVHQTFLKFKADLMNTLEVKQILI